MQEGLVSGFPCSREAHEVEEWPKKVCSDFQTIENMRDFQRVQVTFLDELLEVVLC